MSKDYEPTSFYQCVGCGQPLSIDTEFCPHCGQKGLGKYKRTLKQSSSSLNVVGFIALAVFCYSIYKIYMINDKLRAMGVIDVYKTLLTGEARELSTTKSNWTVGAVISGAIVLICCFGIIVNRFHQRNLQKHPQKYLKKIM